MATARPDIILYAINFLLVLMAGSIAALLYWYCWSNIIGFGAQQYLQIDLAEYLASELEEVLSKSLIVIVPCMAAVSALKITHEYEILWWLKWRPTSVRVRVYGFLLLMIGAYSLLSASSALSIWAVEATGLADEAQKFIGVAVCTALFFSTVSCFLLLGIVGFFNSFLLGEYRR